MKFGHTKIPQAFYIGIALYLMFITFYFPKNLVLTIPVILFPLFIYRLFWINTQPNTIFFGLLFQWLAVSAQLLYCNFLGISLEQRVEGTEFPGFLMEKATYLSIGTMYSLATGIFLAIRKTFINDVGNKIFNIYDVKKVVHFYFFASIIINIVSVAIWAMPSIAQYVTFFLYIKWGFFIVTFYIVHKLGYGTLRKKFYFFILLEFLLGLATFFSSSFITIILHLLIGVSLLQPKLSFRSAFLSLFILVLIINVSILWTVIKQDYRSFITNGQISQSVTIDRASSTNELFNLIGKVDEQTYVEGINKLIYRIGYVQYLAAVMDFVPSKKPHENGKLFLGAIEQNIKPRFLFPDKKSLDDSKHTNEYTSLVVTGSEGGTSIGIGYVSDAFIDFGEIYMFPIILVMGYFIGQTFRFFIIKNESMLWQWVFTVPYFLLLKSMYETDTNKVFGWFMLYFLTCAIFRKIVISFIDPIILKRTDG